MSKSHTHPLMWLSKHREIKKDTSANLLEHLLFRVSLCVPNMCYDNIKFNSV